MKKKKKNGRALKMGRAMIKIEKQALARDKDTYEFVLRVRVLKDEIKGVRVNREAVREAVEEALLIHGEQCGDAISETGDWDSDGVAIVANMECEVR